MVSQLGLHYRFPPDMVRGGSRGAKEDGRGFLATSSNLHSGGSSGGMEGCVWDDEWEDVEWDERSLRLALKALKHSRSSVKEESL